MNNKVTVFKEESSKVPVKCWVGDMGVEEEAKKQLLNLSQLPFINSHIAVMPDCHAGKGSTVGSVISTIDCIIPAAVGVDLNCGMMAVKTSLTANDLPDDLFSLRCEIERNVPHGRTNDGKEGDQGAWQWQNLPISILHNARVDFLRDGLKNITEKHPKINSQRWMLHLGTLGTGNHFIEICLDTNNDVWIMLHSGSRGIGNKIGSYFISKAKEEMEKWYIHLPDKDLSYLPENSKYFYDYIKALNWAGHYATLNRELMMQAVISSMNKVLNKNFKTDLMAVNCHHNYVSIERHFGKDCYVTRKGAVSAKKDELGIIPGSMGAKSFIVKGKGNRETFHSCSHGAGRIMSRTKAKEVFTLKDHIQSTHGVECRKDIDVIDETPKAYKNIEDVMAAQTDSIEILYTLKQILCVKG